jgi:hypothetical protein
LNTLLQIFPDTLVRSVVIAVAARIIGRTLDIRKTLREHRLHSTIRYPFAHGTELA